MEFIAILWFVCGLIAAIVATNKGRSGCGWFLVGVLLGPLGFILALVVSRNEPEIEKRSIQSGDLKKCPFCAELVKREAVVCKHCGRDLPAA